MRSRESDMIDLKGTMGIPFLKKRRFTGSDGALRFLLEKRDIKSVPEGALWPAGGASSDGAEQPPTEAGSGGAKLPTGGADPIGAEQPPTKAGCGDCLAAVCWKGPYCSDVTPEEEKTTAFFAFDEEGLARAQAWLNRMAGAGPSDLREEPRGV